MPLTPVPIGLNAANSTSNMFPHEWKQVVRAMRLWIEEQQVLKVKPSAVLDRVQHHLFF